MDSIKLIEDNSFNNDKNLQKIKKVKEVFDDPFSKKLKVKDFKSNHSEKQNDIFSNLYPENSFKFQKANFKKYTTGKFNEIFSNDIVNLNLEKDQKNKLKKKK